ncbi:flavin-containing monooxygenase 5-like isoform X2 [Ornithodoros turicata]
MHNKAMLSYFQSYSKHFDLGKCFQPNKEVIRVKQDENFVETGRWHVVLRHTKTGVESQEIFDAVMICIGHHVYPHMPNFPGQENFKGTIVHTHSVKEADDFKNQRVVVVGLGNSAGDAAVEIGNVASQVYLSTRRGGWVMKRVGPNGIPRDLTAITRLNNYAQRILPESFISGKVEDMLNAAFDHEAYGLKPKHRFHQQHPTTNDEIPNKILSGQIMVKGRIVGFTSEGVLFEGEQQVTPVDAVVLGTGYEFKFPFLPESIVPVHENRVRLYKYVIPPDLPHPTLAVIGLVQPLGPIFPVAEMQARWFAHLLGGKIRLPQTTEMHRDINAKQEAVDKRFVPSLRHTLEMNWVDGMDAMASEIGACPNLVKYFFTDQALFWKLVLGPAVPYQYRLEGPHAWKGARDAIFGVRARIVAPLNKSQKWFTGEESASRTVCIMIGLLFIALAYVLCRYC